MGYSSLLGPVGGILIVDYYLIHNKELLLADLYQASGAYRFSSGFNQSAIAALILGILPNVPGFLLTVGLVGANVFPVWLTGLYHYACFVGFALSGLVYWLLMKKPS